MARQVEVKLLCDPCLARDQETAGEEYTVTLTDQKPLLVCLCEPHRKEFYDPIADALSIYGQRPAEELLSSAAAKKAQRASYPSVRAERGSGEHVCPVPDCGKRYGWRGTLRSHVISVHGTSLAHLEGAKEPDQACPECDRVFDTAQGLNLHLTRIHRRNNY